MTDELEARILVADDEDRFRTALVEALEFFNYNVLQAKNGDELQTQARHLLEEGPPYLLIVDNQMPERRGEPERQWCGFNQVLALCRDYPEADLGTRVLFLSRWGIEDLPTNVLSDAREHGLLKEEHWRPVHIPFSILKEQINKLIS